MKPTSLRSWRALFWEPVAGTGERLMAGVIYEDSNGKLVSKKTLREDILHCLYGTQSESANKLIDFGISLMLAITQSEGLDSKIKETSGIHLGPLQKTAANTDYQLLRTVVLMHSSLSMIEDSDTEDDYTSKNASEDGNRQFSTRIKDHISQDHPELVGCFNRSIELNGLTMRFGYLSPKATVHFNVITPQRLSSGVGAARAKLWELNLATENKKSKVALINAFTSEDDPTLTSRQLERLRASKHALGKEASSKDIKLLVAESIQSASEHLLTLAI